MLAWTCSLFLLILISNLANARWLKLDEASGYYESMRVLITVKKDGSSTRDVETIYRIQSEDAVETFSHERIEYNSATDKLELITAETINGNQIIKVDESAIEDRDKGDSKDYDAIRVRSVIFPQVEVGSKIHLRYKKTDLKSIVPGRWSTYYSVEPGIFVKNFRLEIRSELPLYHDVRDPGRYLRIESQSRLHVILTSRKQIPGEVFAEKEPAFHPDRISEIWLTTERSWSSFFEPIRDGFEKVLKAVDQAKIGKALPSGRGKTEADRALKLLARVTKDYRYFGDWRRVDGGFTPRSLKDILHSHYGDCKDLSTLMVAALRKMGIEAQVALVYRGENAYGEYPDMKLPAMEQFNHAIVYARLDGQDRWLDPTNAVVSLGSLYDIAGRQALILNTEFERKRIPPSTPAQYEEKYDFQYHQRDLSEWDVKMGLKFLSMAAYELGIDLISVSKSRIISGILQIYTDGLEVRSYKFSKVTVPNRIIGDLDYRFQIRTGPVTYKSKESNFYPFSENRFTSIALEYEGRESDIKLHYRPYRIEINRVFEGAKLVETSKDCKLESPWISIERQVAEIQSGVRMSQVTLLKKTFIRKHEYRTPEFQKLLVDLKRCFYRTGMLIEFPG